MRPNLVQLGLIALAGRKRFGLTLQRLRLLTQRWERAEAAANLIQPLPRRLGLGRLLLQTPGVLRGRGCLLVS